MLRIFIGMVWILVLIQVVTDFRPDLLHPADFGSDTSNYAAAGERILHGELYRLAPGDRPVSVDNPPEWSVPILSPPPVATIWAALGVLPDALRFHVPWLAGLGATSALVIYLTARTPIVPLIAAVYLLFAGLGVMAWSGNVNALIGPGMAAVWLLTSRKSSRAAQVSAGVIVALAALVKLGPAVLAIWLLTQRRWEAIVACVATGVVGLLITTWLGRFSVFEDYLGIIRDASALPSPLSIPGLAVSVGVPAAYGSLSLLVALLVAAAAVIVFRCHPRATFALTVMMAVMATTVARFDTLVVVVAALTPFAATSSVGGLTGSRRPSSSSVVLALTSMVVVAGGTLAVATGGLARTSVSINNQAIASVVVRFSVPNQDATFGFPLAAGATGIAWLDQMGSIARTVLVFSPSCELLYRYEPTGVEAAIQIAGDGVTAAGSFTNGPAFLAYTSDCAAEARSAL